MTERLELPQGTLDVLILKSVALEPQHGWAISERLHQLSSETLLIRQGSLYPALHRLERQRWIRAEWKLSENNQRARVYQLTAAGRKQLAAERSRWAQLSTAIAGILNRPGESEA
jgi:PadR family transcriptional regulator